MQSMLLSSNFVYIPSKPHVFFNLRLLIIMLISFVFVGTHLYLESFRNSFSLLHHHIFCLWVTYIIFNSLYKLLWSMETTCYDSWFFIIL